MKVCSQVACLALILLFVLAGCGGAPATPAAVKTESVLTQAPPTAAPTQVAPIQAAPTQVTPTPIPPSATSLPPTAPPPTEMPLPPPSATPLPAAAATETSTPVAALANLPVEGVWTGGGSKLLLDFVVKITDGQASLTNIGILWEGRNDCELNARYDVTIPVKEDVFVMNYLVDEVSFTLKGTVVSSTVMQGLLDLSVEGCGDHEVSWRAVPKVKTSP